MKTATGETNAAVLVACGMPATRRMVWFQVRANTAHIATPKNDENKSGNKKKKGAREINLRDAATVHLIVAWSSTRLFRTITASANRASPSCRADAATTAAPNRRGDDKGHTFEALYGEVRAAAES